MFIGYFLMILYIIQISLWLFNKYSNHTFLNNISILTSWEDGTLKNMFAFLVVIGFLINLVPIVLYPSRIKEMLSCTLHFIAY